MCNMSSENIQTFYHEYQTTDINLLIYFFFCKNTSMVRSTARHAIHLQFDISVNPLTAATSLGVKRLRALNTTINIKDIL
jgi:hypothetical protein